MTLPSPIPAATSSAPALPRGVARLKLCEPVRLYLWPVAALLLTGSVICAAAWEWLGAAMLATCGLLLVLAAEAVRTSVFSPCGAMQERVNAALTARLR